MKPRNCLALSFVAIAGFIASLFGGSNRNNGSAPRDSRTVKFIRVVDGDTILVMFDGERTRVRLHCVDTPESVHPDPYRNTVQGKQASQFTKSLMAGVREVELLFEKSPQRQRDQYGRLLAYVVIHTGSNTQNVNLVLIQSGWSKYEQKWGKSTYFHDQMMLAEREARKKGAGIWKRV